MPADRVPRKTERSHEENQERAYIAASRRADRSIEARVQSARMASDIHKRRTGKGFKISEEIVMKEEMYEEEDEDLPRYRALAALGHPPNSADLSERLSHLAGTEIGVNKIAHMMEVERQFAESFPHHARMQSNNYMRHAGPQSSFQHHQQQHYQQQQHRQHHPQQQYYHRLQQHPRHTRHQAEPPNRGYSHSPMLDYTSQYGRERAQSISQASAGADMAARRHTIAAGMLSYNSLHPQLQVSGLGDETGSSSISPPALTPGAVDSSGSSSSGGNGIETPSNAQYLPNFTTSNSFASIPATASADTVGNVSMSPVTNNMNHNMFHDDLAANFHSIEAMDGAEQSFADDWNGEPILYREPDMYSRDMDLETRDACGGYFEQQPPSDAGSAGMTHSLKLQHSHQQPSLAMSSAAEDYFSHAPTTSAGAPPSKFEDMSAQHGVAVTPGTENFDTFFDMEQYAGSTHAAAWNNHIQG